MQLRLTAPPDLRDPGDPDAAARHREAIEAWSGTAMEGQPAVDAEAARRLEVVHMGQAGWRCWLPDESRLARRLGPDAPRLLFAAGAPDLAAPAVAVVGTRRPDAYGLAMARRIGRALGQAGTVVVSGGALGIDAAAHEGALEAGGRTMVVLGGGLGMPHPASNRDLFDRVAATPGCCVLSEAPCLGPARHFSFPRRNRILAALSDAVVVVQAGVPSGALITAERARGMGVPVFAVPGDAWYERSSGANALLRSGALVFASPADLEAVPDLRGLSTACWPRPGSRPRGLPSPWEAEPGPPPEAAGPDVDVVLAALSFGARSVDALVASTALHAGRIQAALLSLEIAGVIRVLPGGVVVPL